RADVPLGPHPSVLRWIDTRDHLQQGALPGAVVTDETDALARLDREGDRPQRVDRPPHGPVRAEAARDHRLQRVVSFSADAEVEINVFQMDACHDVHAISTTVGTVDTEVQ